MPLGLSINLPLDPSTYLSDPPLAFFSLGYFLPASWPLDLPLGPLVFTSFP